MRKIIKETQWKVKVLNEVWRRDNVGIDKKELYSKLLNMFPRWLRYRVIQKQKANFTPEIRETRRTSIPNKCPFSCNLRWNVTNSRTWGNTKKISIIVRDKFYVWYIILTHRSIIFINKDQCEIIIYILSCYLSIWKIKYFFIKCLLNIAL